MDRYNNLDIKSSYHSNNLGEDLYNFVLENKPNTIIEFGILNGYSLISMALALKKLGNGKIIAYDLFEEYNYNKPDTIKLLENIKKYEVLEYIELKKGSLFDWFTSPEEFDLMHVDVSNDGDVILQLYNNIKKYLDKGSILLFEGGSQERDEVHWMKKYNKTPINDIKPIINYKLLTEKFPSISYVKS